MQQGNNNPIYLLYGSESYLLELGLKKIKKAFGDLVLGINYIIIDETNSSKIIPNIETPAFGYEKKLIIVKNANLFQKETKRKTKASDNGKLAEELNEYINQNIEMIKESIVLVIIETEVEKNKLYETIEKYGEILCFKPQTQMELVRTLKSICDKYEVVVDTGVLKYLVEVCGTNMQDLMNEIRKQIEYAGKNGTITKEAIDCLAIKQIESKIFDFTDYLGSKKIKEAMDELNALIKNKEPVQRLIIMLYNHFKKLYFVKLAEEEGANIAEVLKLKPNQLFLVGRYKKQQSYFEKQQLRDILTEFINLDSNSKIGLIDLQIGLEAILCNYCN